MHFNIISDTNRKIPRKRIKEILALIDEDEDPPDSTVNVIFVRDTAIAELNKSYRKINKPTDVLSFNIDATSGDDNIFGEIYISTDTAAHYAEVDGIGYFDMIIKLCTHGFLHLLGYDHETERDKGIMLEQENYFLSKVREC